MLNAKNFLEKELAYLNLTVLLFELKLQLFKIFSHSIFTIIKGKLPLFSSGVDESTDHNQSH
jgi:hypothetical protein